MLFFNCHNLDNLNKRTESYFTLEHEIQTAITDLRHQDIKLEAKLM